MASESRLYTFSGETKDHLRKFRLTTSRAKDPQAVICMYVSLSAPVPLPPRHAMPKLTDSPDMIDKHTYEIRQDEDKVVYKSLEEVGDDLPDHAPRFVLLSYPLTMGDGRLSVPYVLLFYLPVTCNAEMRMLYAGAKELMRNTSEAGRIIDIESVEDLEEIPDKLKSG
ncbi:ADF-H domain-containing protein [Fusarium keratoplasticum]|uniref:ADF-H domain-containing protein n=1 Tax=Fusarium keratoplasticum TaxID=1328300 RepID=A0ACC0R9G4_9HYPO|nr:ADF-H domain-containing protein [Fusarium keratoplasticum]KAI8679794.1 ADF-H domain-containing protein [Fusarium keratoplasticum]KAI8685881.1 ADF-H domain-containing protein [Fusarium keratoplasticum]